MDIRWPKIINKNPLWEASRKKPIILKLKSENDNGSVILLRKGVKSIEKQALDWNPQGTRREG
jgi:hypothetical protein